MCEFGLQGREGFNRQSRQGPLLRSQGAERHGGHWNARGNGVTLMSGPRVGTPRMWSSQNSM